MAEPEVLVEPRDLRTTYDEESLEHCQRSVRGASILGLILVAAFAPFDALRYPQVSTEALQIRFIAMLGLTAVLGLARLDIGKRFARQLGVALPVTIATMICGMMILTGGQRSSYFSGLSMILLATALAIHWRPSWTAAVCGAVMGVYLLASTVVGELDQVFVDNLFILLPTAVIAIVMTTINERLRWREFQTRWTVAEAYRHKNEFFSNMSHELRTPIHVIIGYMDMLLDEAIETTQEEGHTVLERVRQEGMLLYRLVSDLLDYAKVEAGRMEVQSEPFDLRELLEHVAESFRPLADRKHLHVGVRVRSHLPIVHSDRQKLQQVLNNLVGNAVKFTESGSIHIEATLASELDETELSGLLFLDEPSVDGAAQGAMEVTFAISVSDTGLGIRENDLSKLAIDFQQVNVNETPGSGGTGLGLSLSRKLVGLLGGRIAVRSRYRRGSTFLLLLPAQGTSGCHASRPGEQEAADDRLLHVAPLDGEAQAAASATVSVSAH